MSYLAILFSAIASMIIGSVWYGPLFGKKFMKAAGMDKWSKEKQEAEKKKMGKLYGMQLIASLVTFYVLSVFVGQASGMSAVAVAFWVWIGFVIPTQFGSSLWGGNMNLFWLGAGNMLVTLLAAGMIIGAWN